MFQMIKSENLKYKRSFSKKLVLIAPLFFVLYAVIAQMYLPSGKETSWNTFISMVFNWWPLIFIPLGTALLCVLSENRERKSGDYCSLRMHNINPALFWLSKISVLTYYTLLLTVTMIAVVLLTGLATASGSIPFGKILRAGMTIWVVSLSLIPIQLFISAWKGTVASLGLGVLGMLVGIVAAPSSYWSLIPWSWTLRLMCPIIGVHPNGIQLQQGDALFNPSVILPGIVISLVFFVITAILTSIWFSKREVG